MKKHPISLLAVLACLLAAFITPSAHAAATYDITHEAFCQVPF